MDVLKVLIPLVFFSIANNQVKAASIDFIDNDTYTTDTISGLDWLDVTKSVDQSYNYVSSQFFKGGEYDGWQYATGYEFNSMVTNYTGSTTITTLTETVTHSEGSIDGLVRLLGSTLDSLYLQITSKTYDNYYGRDEGEYLDYTLGLLKDTRFTSSYHYLAMIYDNDVRQGSDDTTTAWSELQHPYYDKGFHYGSYLVRQTTVQTVPEPSTITLLLFSLISLSCRQKEQLGVASLTL